MNSIGEQDPWTRRLWPWEKRPIHLEFSQLWLVVIVAFNLVLLAWLGINWQRNTQRLHHLDLELSTLIEEREWTEERVQWARSFLRTRQAVASVAQRRMNPYQITRISEILWAESRTFGFDPLLVVAVMQCESRSNPKARGQFRSGEASGALGLMQIKLETAQVMGRQVGLEIHSAADLERPDVNLMLGTFYLLRQIVRYGNISHGLMAYNIGPYAFDRRLRSGARLPIAYSRRILIEYSRLTQSFGRESLGE